MKVALPLEGLVFVLALLVCLGMSVIAAVKVPWYGGQVRVAKSVEVIQLASAHRPKSDELVVIGSFTR